MCGITGFTGEPKQQTLEAMVNSMTHRGPDEAGLWSNGKISLGMRRLSIIDLSGGQQPVFNESNSLSAVMNGEIYNFIELRKDLEAKGHKFRSDHSDTELIPHLYEEFGRDFVKQLNGMFGIAIWDKGASELLLFRDYCGIKPLYYTQVGEELIFGSELKAILKHPKVKREPNFEALYHYFSLKNIPAPFTAFKNIFQLGAGQGLSFKKGQIQKWQWWSAQQKENFDISEAEAAKEIRRLLQESVKFQMRSDVPFGAYLSGGVDSSSVVALMSELGAKKIKTFTLGYEDGFSYKNADQAAAERVSKMYGTDHHVHMMGHGEIEGLIDRVIEAFDEPFSGTASTFFLTGLIAKHVKVALSGDGADELFGSYLPHRLARPLSLFPKFESRWGKLAAEEIALVQPYYDQPELLKSIVARGDEAARRMGQFVYDDQTKRKILTEKIFNLAPHVSTEKIIREAYTQNKYTDPLNRALYLDFTTLLPDQILPFVDRLSMAHSVEVRPPFLDNRLMEFVWTLPGTMEIKNGRVKHILKEAVKDLLPVDLLDRPKEGFVLPVNDWLRGSLKEYTRQLLSESELSKHGLFNQKAIDELVEGHLSGEKNSGPQVWNVMMFQVWWNKFFN